MCSRTAQLKPFNCRRCGHETAQTDGVDLYFGVQKVPGEPLRVGWLCSKCGYPMKWSSTRDRIPLTERHKIA